MPAMKIGRDARAAAVSAGSSASSNGMQIVRWLDRVRGEYREMPGLSLTEYQAQRLWGLDADICRALFDALTQTGFLHRTEGGAYVRGTNGL